MRSPLEFLGLMRFFTRSNPSPAELSLGGAVSGLVSGGKVDITNNSETVSVSEDGNFTFPTKLKTGTTYDVTIAWSGVSTMTCTLTNGKGTMQADNIANVSIVCTNASATTSTTDYEVGVSVTGITSSLSVQLNSSESLTFSTAALHKFTTRLATNATYTVTISAQTAGSVCAFEEPSASVGTMASANVTIFIRCVTGYLSGGTIQTVAAATLVNPSNPSPNFYLRTMVGGYPTNTPGPGPGPSPGNVPLGTATSSANLARFINPKGMATDGTFVYVVDYGNNLIRKINKSNGDTTTFAGGNAGGGTTCPGTTTTNCKDGVGTAAQFHGPFRLTTDGTSLYVLEFDGHRIRKINLTTAQVTTLAGNGNAAPFADNANGLLASFNFPHDITLYNGILFVADRYNNRIRAVSPVTGAVSTFAGTGVNGYADLNGTSAQFDNPLGIVGLGGFLYIADIGNQRIRKISLSGTNPVTTVAGTGTAGSVDGFGTTSAQFDAPFSIATDGTDLFISDYTTYKIRHLRLSDARVITLVGSGSAGYVDEVGSNAAMGQPVYLLSDGANLYVSEEANHAIRRLENAELLRYTFDGNSNDSIGTNNGLWTGSPTSTVDENGNATGAYEFNGTTDYISSNTSVSFNSSQITDYLTISAWVHPSGGTTDQVIFSNGTIGTDGYALIFQASTRYLYIQVNGTASGLSTNKIPLNQWSHVTIKSFNHNWRLSLNGRDQGIVFNSIPNTLTSNFAVAYGGPLSFFKGKVSDVRIFKGALDDDAIQRLAIQVPSGLISYFPLNGNSKDFGNYFNDLSVSGATPTSDRNGHANGSYNFNGGSFLQKLNPNGLPTGGNARTNCAWFRTTNSAGQYIVGYGTMTGSSGNGLVITSTVTGNFGVTDDVTIFHEDFLNQWMHLCGVYDSSTAYIYENGVLRASQNKTWTTATSPNLEVGRLINGTGNFFGDIDDVRIYDRALTVSEMKAIAGNYPTQVSSWNQTLASSSLKFYLMPEAASYGAGICSGGVNCVGFWVDRSGNGYNVSQGLGLRQPFLLNNGINGAAAIRFVGTSSDPAYLTAACVADMIGSTNTIFSVFSESSQSGNNGIFQNGAPNPPGPGGKLLYITRGGGSYPTLFNLFSNTPINQSTSPFNAINEPVILSLDYNGASGILLKNGTVSSSANTAAPTFSCTGGNLEIGRYYYGGSYPFDGGYFDGLLGDFIYFNQVLSTSDRQIVECYLSNKYNIPVGHTCP